MEDQDLSAETTGPSEPTMEALLREQGTLRERLDAREVVWVRVVQAHEKGVLVDIGEKHEGVIPVPDFAPDELPAPGSRIPAILVSRGRDDRSAILSTKKARTQLGWDLAAKAFQEKTRVRGRVTAAVKGGFLVDVNGVGAFLPSSLADLRPVRKPQSMVGTGVRCIILELNAEKKQLVLSRAAVLEEEARKRKDKLLESIKPGDVRIGRVIHCAQAGIFVDLGGVEGCVPTAELAWKEPEKAQAAVAHGAKLRLKVLRIDAETGKITLGAKQLTPNPADALRKKYPLKSVLSGKVLALQPEGVRVRVSEGVTAFCPADELQADGKPAAGERDFGQRRAPKGPPPNILWPKVGDEVKGVVLGVHLPTCEVTLSIRRYEDAQDRKRVAKYLKGPPPLTLGQILTSEE